MSTHLVIQPHWTVWSGEFQSGNICPAIEPPAIPGYLGHAGGQGGVGGQVNLGYRVQVWNRQILLLQVCNTCIYNWHF